MSLNVQSIIFCPQKKSWFQNCLEFQSTEIFQMHSECIPHRTARARCLVFPQGAHDDSLQRQLNARELNVMPGIGQLLLPVVGSLWDVWALAKNTTAMGFSGESRNHPCKNSRDEGLVDLIFSRQKTSV